MLFFPLATDSSSFRDVPLQFLADFADYMQKVNWIEPEEVKTETASKKACSSH